MQIKPNRYMFTKKVDTPTYTHTAGDRGADYGQNLTMQICLKRKEHGEDVGEGLV